MLTSTTPLSGGTATVQYGDDMVIDRGVVRYFNDYGNPVNHYYPDYPGVGIGYFSSNHRRMRYYYKSPIPEFLFQHQIDSAFIYLSRTNSRGCYGTQSWRLTANEVTETIPDDFEEYYGGGEEPEHNPTNCDTSELLEWDYEGWVILNITSLVNAWLFNDRVNNGVVFRLLPEGTPTQQEISFSQSTGTVDVRPKLVIHGETIPDTVIRSTVVGLDPIAIQPETLELSSFPNPFNPSTTIEYEVPETGHIKLEVFNILGQPISTLVNKKVTAGQHAVTFHGGNLPSGIYFYRIQSGDYFSTRKMVLNR